MTNAPMDENWRIITESPLDGKAYEISSQGRLKVNGKERFPFLSTKGYAKVTLGNRSVSIHRLVAKAFIENVLNEKEVNHLDGIKTNNRVENLEWCSRSKNMKHAYASGLHRGVSFSGEDHALFGKTGHLHKDSMPVRGTFPDGTFIDFESQKLSAEKGFNPCKISMCINGKNKTHRGATWMPLPAPPIPQPEAPPQQQGAQSATRSRRKGRKDDRIDIGSKRHFTADCRA